MRVETAIRSIGQLTPVMPRETGNCGGSQPLLSLAGSGIADRFRTWTGRSGRRYIFSVYALGANGVPPLGEAVVIGLEREGGDRRAVRFVADTGAEPDDLLNSAGLAALRSRPGAELHLHLTAADGEERQRIAADLQGLDLTLS